MHLFFSSDLIISADYGSRSSVQNHCSQVNDTSSVCSVSSLIHFVESKFQTTRNCTFGVTDVNIGSSETLNVQFRIELLGGGWLSLMQSKITTNINFNRDGNFGSEQQNIRSGQCLAVFVHSCNTRATV